MLRLSGHVLKRSESAEGSPNPQCIKSKMGLKRTLSGFTVCGLGVQTMQLYGCDYVKENNNNYYSFLSLHLKEN